MSVTIAFPEMSKDPDAEGVVATWFVDSGESVKAGQVIAEVMVDKVSVDIEAPIDGILTCLIEEEGVVKQGQDIAVIE